MDGDDDNLSFSGWIVISPISQKATKIPKKEPSRGGPFCNFSFAGALFGGFETNRKIAHDDANDDDGDDDDDDDDSDDGDDDVQTGNTPLPISAHRCLDSFFLSTNFTPGHACNFSSPDIPRSLEQIAGGDG